MSIAVLAGDSFRRRDHEATNGALPTPGKTSSDRERGSSSSNSSPSLYRSPTMPASISRKLVPGLKRRAVIQAAEKRSSARDSQGESAGEKGLSQDSSAKGILKRRDTGRTFLTLSVDADGLESDEDVLCLDTPRSAGSMASGIPPEYDDIDADSLPEWVQQRLKKLRTVGSVCNKSVLTAERVINRQFNQPKVAESFALSD